MVLESVACVPPGLERSAWETFFLAFQKKISVDLFVEETHHAEQWERSREEYSWFFDSGFWKSFLEQGLVNLLKEVSVLLFVCSQCSPAN